MPDRRRRRTLLWFVGALAICTVAFLHPWLSPTERSGTDTLVVEGWMSDEGLRSAAVLFREGGYQRLWVTGTLRPFGYWLHAGDTLSVRASPQLHGTVSLQMAGLPGVPYTVELNGTRKQGVVQGDLRPAEMPPSQQGLGTLRLFAEHEGIAEEDAALLFAVHLRVDGKDLHHLPAHIAIHHANSDRRPGTPTYAALGAAKLMELGIPAEVITTVPVHRSTERTRGAAAAIAELARNEGISGFDVATQGVHARRTWTHFRRAAGPLPVGVVAMEDPKCRRWNWWLHGHGWAQVLKELIAIPQWLVPWRTAASNTTRLDTADVSSAHAAVDPPRP